MSNSNIQIKIEEIRNEKKKQGNTKERVASVLTDLNNRKADLIDGKVPVDQLDRISWDSIENKPEVFPPSTHNHDDRYYTEVETDDFLNKKADLIDGIIPEEQLPPIKELFAEDISVSLPLNKTFGKYSNGQVIPAKGKTAREVILLAALDTLYPSFVAPTFSLSHNQSGTKEVGESVNLVLTATFNQGQIRGAIVNNVWDPNAIQNPRSGVATNYTIDGTSGSTNTKTLNNFIIPLITKTFSASVDYTTGVQPKDSTNMNYDSPLTAGTLNAQTSIVGYLRRFAGQTDSIPTDGVAIRTALLGTSVLNTSNSFSIVANGTSKNWVAAVPNNKTLTGVMTSNNENVLGNFSLSAITQIPDASGAMQNYKVYIMTTVTPFSAGLMINFSLS